MNRFLSALALASIVATPALAQGKSSTKAQLDAEFTLSDTNKDGALTRAEVDVRMARMKVRGAAVTPQQAKALSTIWFARADADGNGKVTRAELGKAFERTFDQYDRNRDGTISPAERAAATRAAKAVQGPAAPTGR